MSPCSSPRPITGQGAGRCPDKRRSPDALGQSSESLADFGKESAQPAPIRMSAGSSGSGVG
ncbi:hypothetical protein OEZ78_25710, partial [Leclercia adecarboxylata]